MDMDLTYFESTAPVIQAMTTVIIAMGWALLLSNLFYQALRTMLHGAGFESEDPKILACRTMAFAFLLIVSRDICNIGLSISGQVIEWLQFPAELGLVIPAEEAYDVSSSARWLIAIIVGVILVFQIVKLLFEIGERYVIVAILTYFAPLAFGLGGSRNTQDIFKGWCRMYCSMLVMMIMSTAFLKLIISAMEHAGDGNILIWLIFVVAMARVARKLDSHIAKIGLNPAVTGDALGSRLPGMLTAVAVRNMATTIRSNGQSSRIPTPNPGGGSTAYREGSTTNNTTTAATVTPIPGNPTNTRPTSVSTAVSNAVQNTVSSQSVATVQQQSAAVSNRPDTVSNPNRAAANTTIPKPAAQGRGYTLSTGAAKPLHTTAAAAAARAGQTPAPVISANQNITSNNPRPVTQGTEAPPPAVTQPSAVTPPAVQGGSNSRQDIRPDIRAVPPVTPASPRPVTPASSPLVTPASSQPVTPASSRPVTPASSPPVTPASSRPAAPASPRPVTPASSRPVAPASSRPAASAPANAGRPPTPAPAQTVIPKTPVQPSHRGGYRSYSKPSPGTNQSSESGKNNRENDKGR